MTRPLSDSFNASLAGQTMSVVELFSISSVGMSSFRYTDGNESISNHYRGQDTYKRIINNLKLIKKNNFQGELIARMTVMEKTDIYKQVKWLLENNDFNFSSVHWQLNAGFWGTDYLRRNFVSWSKNNYIPRVRKLVNY